MTLTKFTSEQINLKLTEIPGWKIQDSKLHREFSFVDFVEAFGFMSMSHYLPRQQGIIRNGSTCTTQFELILPRMTLVESVKLILILQLRLIASVVLEALQRVTQPNNYLVDQERLIGTPSETWSSNI